MRCTRCDGLAVPQATGRTRRGRLVFGWCLRCLDEEGVEILSIDGEGQPDRPRRRGRGRPITSPSDDPVRRSRQRSLRWLAALLAAWGSMLSVAGAGLLWRSDASGRGAGVAGPLLAGGLMLALIGAGMGLTTLDRPSALRWGMRAARWVGAALAFGALGWAIWGDDPRRNMAVMGVVAAGVAISLLARSIEVRLGVRGPGTAKAGARPEDL